jgi:hypothetical protein
MKTEKMPSTPHQWQLFRRLQAAGCPVNWDNWEEPCHPLHMVHEPCALGTELFPLEEYTGLAFRLRITAAVGFTISKLTIAFNWSHEPILWLNDCKRHERYCLHNCCQGEVRLVSSNVLNHRIHGLTLKRDQSVSGYLALILDQVVPTSAGSQLEATLSFEDPLGRSYPYSLLLNNTQQITGSGDGYCRFLTADQLAQEREAQLAAQAAKAQEAELKARREAELKNQPPRSLMAECLDQEILKMQRERESTGNRS